MGDDDSTSKAARIGLEILGWLLLAAGVAALVLPGPGLLLLALGLWVLAKNYRWADRLLDPVKRVGYRRLSHRLRSAGARSARLEHEELPVRRQHPRRGVPGTPPRGGPAPARLMSARRTLKLDRMCRRSPLSCCYNYASFVVATTTG